MSAQRRLRHPHQVPQLRLRNALDEGARLDRQSAKQTGQLDQQGGQPISRPPSSEIANLAAGRNVLQHDILWRPTVDRDAADTTGAWETPQFGRVVVSDIHRATDREVTTIGKA